MNSHNSQKIIPVQRNRRPYTLAEFADFTGKSKNLIHRRLSEKPRKYSISSARKEGGTWVFDPVMVDEALSSNTPLIEKIVYTGGRITEAVFNAAIEHFKKKPTVCGKDNENV